MAGEKAIKIFAAILMMSLFSLSLSLLVASPRPGPGQISVAQFLEECGIPLVGPVDPNVTPGPKPKPNSCFGVCGFSNGQCFCDDSCVEFRTISWFLSSSVVCLLVGWLFWGYLEKKKGKCGAAASAP